MNVVLFSVNKVNEIIIINTSFSVQMADKFWKHWSRKNQQSEHKYTHTYTPTQICIDAMTYTYVCM